MYFSLSISAALLSATALVSAVTKFTREANDTVAYVGQNISIEWEYSVTDRNSEFALTSPVWNYENTNGQKSILASESYSNGWAWKISSFCPSRLLSPTLRLYRVEPGKIGIATLYITNVTLNDTGKYECRLDLISGRLSSSMFLNVTAPPPTPSSTVTPPTRNVQTTTKSTTPSTISPTSTVTVSSTTPSTPPTESPTTPSVLSGPAIAGIVVAVIVLVGVAVGVGIYIYKKKKSGN